MFVYLAHTIIDMIEFTKNIWLSRSYYGWLENKLQFLY